MKSKLFLMLAVAAAAVLLAWGATTQPTITAAIPVGNNPTGVVVNPSTNPIYAANPVVWAQDCSTTQPGTTRVTFLWTPSRAGPQWLDLSLFDNGFPPGMFVGVGPLPAEAWGFVWDGLQPGATHYLRVNTLSQGGWQSSGTLAFTTIACGPDMAVQQSCSPTSGLVDVTFRWTPRLLSGIAQWIDLSVFDNGFVPGTFISAGPLSAVASSFQWAGLRPGLLHYWRVNTRTTVVGWAPSQTVSFQTDFCAMGAPTAPPPSAR
jgi:hypothetical protein